MEAVLVRSTYAREKDAWKAGHDLVSRRLAACVHVQSVRCCYRWEGAVRDESEWLLEVRTVPALAKRVHAAIVEGHPYEVPLVECITSDVSPGYGAWMGSVTG